MQTSIAASLLFCTSSSAHAPLTFSFPEAGNESEICLQYFMDLIFVNQAEILKGKIINSYEREELFIQPSLRFLPEVLLL